MFEHAMWENAKWGEVAARPATVCGGSREPSSAKAAQQLICRARRRRDAEQDGTQRKPAECAALRRGRAGDALHVAAWRPCAHVRLLCPSAAPSRRQARRVDTNGASRPHGVSLAAVA
eukprot:3518858-Pleurochrysis_carterae.AAC.1